MSMLSHAVTDAFMTALCASARSGADRKYSEWLCSPLRNKENTRISAYTHKARKTHFSWVNGAFQVVNLPSGALLTVSFESHCVSNRQTCLCAGQQRRETLMETSFARTATSGNCSALHVCSACWNRMWVKKLSRSTNSEKGSFCRVRSLE